MQEFTRLILSRDTEAAASFVEDLHRRGASLETLYLGLLTPAAHRLGE